MKKNLLELFSLLLIVIPGFSFGLSSIHIEEAVEIGGIKQWISVNGTNENNPVLLFLHGGPGNSAMGYANKFTNELQKHFLVVQWDQREGGKTIKLNSSSTQLTVSLMESDGVEMINYLRVRFSQNKIYLIGHSWGGFLGLKIAVDNPELLEAYFAVSPMIYQDESERRSLEWMKVRANAKKNTEELKELMVINTPFKSWEDLYYHRKWLASEMGNKPPNRAFVEIWARKWFNLFSEASKINFFVDAPTVECPIYFFVGSQDYQTYFRLTEDFYKMLKAEKKDLFWFTDSAHNPNLTESVKFQEIIISLLKSEH